MKEDCIYVLSDLNSEKVIENITNDKNEDSPFFVCNVDDLILKYKLWKKLFPRIQPHYAVKSNNHLIVLQVLAELGVNFDCASKDEIEQVVSLGVDPSRIIFAHTCKPPNSIQYAQKRNVRLMTFDSEDELYKIKENFPNALTVLRIKHDDVTAKVSLGVKFGCDPYSEAEDLLKLAAKENINVVGVSFHIGFGSNTPIVFYEAIRDAYYVFQIAAKLEFNFNLLDIGGGYPGTNEDDSLLDYSKYVTKGLEDFFPNPSIRIISEPGTFFVKSCFTLACRIQSVKENIIENNSFQYDYRINDGVFGSFAMIIHTNAEYIPVPLKRSNDKPFVSTVWGPSCNSIDKISDNVLLPKMKIGDWMVFKNTGNYTHVMSTNFNGLGSKKIYNIVGYENMMNLCTKWPVTYYKFITSQPNENWNLL